MQGLDVLDGLFWLFMSSLETLPLDWPEEPDHDSEITNGMGFGESQTPI